MSTEKKYLELDAWFGGRIEPLDLCEKRRPTVVLLIDQPKSGEYLERAFSQERDKTS